MPEKNFEKLPVWQSSIHLARRVFHLSGKLRARHPSLADDLERAALATSNHIVAAVVHDDRTAAGDSVSMALVCVAQVHSMLWMIEGADDQKPLRGEAAQTKVLTGRMERYLRGWQATLRGEQVSAPPAGERVKPAAAVADQPLPTEPQDAAGRLALQAEGSALEDLLADMAAQSTGANPFANE